MVDRAVLAGRVDALQDDQDGCASTRRTAAPGGRASRARSRVVLDRRRAPSRARTWRPDPSSRAGRGVPGLTRSCSRERALPGGLAAIRSPRGSRAPILEWMHGRHGPSARTQLLERLTMTIATGAKPHPIFLAGRWVESPDPLVVENPADPDEPAGTHVHTPRRRSTRRRSRPPSRRSRSPATCRPTSAARSCANISERDQGAARGARPAARAGGGQADPRRADRGRSGRPHLPSRRRGGRADVRRGHPARPHGVVARPGRHHPALPDRPDRRHQPVQLPAEPGRAQDLAGDRHGQPDRAQAAVQGPADRCSPSPRSSRRPARRPAR